MTRLFLHIGLQKTGTSYLQNVFWGSLDQLRDQGVTMVPERRVEAFWLALDVRERVEPGHDGPRVARSLELLPEQLEQVSTPAALITHETLGSAGPAQIRRLLAAVEPHEVHVILTVRDVGRLIPSLWQECLKAGRSVTLDEYVAELRATQGTTTTDWRRLDLSAILRRWGAEVRPERIHVVTVPGVGGPREALLERFCSVLGVDPAGLAGDGAGPGNPGLGTAEAELLRRVNGLLPEQYRRRVPYGRIGKRWFAMGMLARTGATRIRLGPGDEQWCRELADRSIATLTELGCQVVGDPADLVPAAGVFGDVRGPDDAAVLDAAVQALASILEQRMAAHLEERARALAAAPVPEPQPQRALRGRLSGLRSRASSALRRAG